MTAARRFVAVLALLAAPFTLMAVAASPAGAHPVERCFFGWTVEDGVAVEGSPEDPRHICRDEYHYHLSRNLIIGAATLAALYPLSVRADHDPGGSVAGEGNPPRAMASYRAPPTALPGTAAPPLAGPLLRIPACVPRWLCRSASLAGAGFPARQQHHRDALCRRLRRRYRRWLAHLGAQAPSRRTARPTTTFSSKRPARRGCRLGN